MARIYSGTSHETHEFGEWQVRLDQTGRVVVDGAAAADALIAAAQRYVSDHPDPEGRTIAVGFHRYTSDIPRISRARIYQRSRLVTADIS